MKHPVADLHRVCKVDYVTVRFDLQLLMLVHKYMYNDSLDAKKLGLLLKQNNRVTVVTRSANTLELIYPTDNKLSYRKSPLYRAIGLWNNLPSACRLLESKSAFKLEALKQVRLKHEASR